MKLPRYLQQLSQIGPVYLVGGSVRDCLLGRHANDHDFVVPGDAKAFAQKVAQRLDSRVIEIGKAKKANYRVVSKEDTLDFADMEGPCIEDDLRRRDFTINALGYDLVGRRLIDPLGGWDDIKGKTIRLVSDDAVAADPLRMLRAFRFSAFLGFSVAPQTLTVIKKERRRITESSQERVCAELFKIMAVDRSCGCIKQMVDSGLLPVIMPEFTGCRGCSQNTFHTLDVFDHTMETYDRLETAVSDPASIWPEFSGDLTEYINRRNRKALLKWVALLHDIGKPACRSVESSGRIRFLGHEKAGARTANAICQRLKMSNRDRTYIVFMVENHLRPLHLFNAAQQGGLTSRAITRFVRKFQDHAMGLLIHAVADQEAKGYNKPRPSEFIRFGESLLAAYLGELKPKMKTPRLISGRDLMERFELKPSKIIGTLLERLEEARVNGEIHTKEEALRMAARLISMEGDAGIEPATPSSGGLCSIR